ncbi:uncharacterized protein LOC124177478 [Neodiprion fabricii]|uniref:uncharacterized protein LOC124177478 n=1 Tax=Neodiprion fabricii TaxID=2872261 RepID=UPI001ED8CEA6|nr:uncharacterized protein LOC124177478 [Neodiprion fabricii]
MRKHYATCFLGVYVCFSVATARFWGIVEESDDRDNDEDDLEEGQATEQVINPDVNTGEPTTQGDNDEASDAGWDANRVIRDVAYFLRTHKFKDFDHRYYGSVSEVPRRLYQEFPKPPLRSLHWEVHKHCAVSFKSCLKFLEEIVKLTPLRRQDDTVTVMREQSWDPEKDKNQITSTQEDCELAKKKDNLTADPFQGPIERFQWRTTASYYMCWYTMLDTPELARFGEPCDNMAYCLDSYGIGNKDPRADDAKPFACAVYSFCPDPCCPLEHIWKMEECYQSQENPCYDGNGADNRKCVFQREDNRDFESLIKNQLNVTCACQEVGYEWSSRFGICVDTDECSTETDKCSKENMNTCINLPGYYDCMCNLGYVYSPEAKSCVFSQAFDKALHGVDDEDANETEVKSVLVKIVKVLTRSKAPSLHSTVVALFSSYILVLCH